MTGVTVTLSGVKKVYDGATEDTLPAVDSLDLDVPAGDVVTLLGASGSGKTTTLRMIAGLERITEGEIRIGDTVMSSPTVHVPPEKRNLGMVFQSYAIWPHMTVLDNVAFPLQVKGMRKRERRERAQEMLQLVSLNDFGGRYPSQLSGGQQQRVALARAIVADPGLVLYDEPLSNLDARLRDRLRDQIRSLHDRLGITAVYVTHDQREAMAISDQIAMMAGGLLQQKGSPSDLYLRPSGRAVAEFVGDASVLAVERVDRKSREAHLTGDLTVVCSDVPEQRDLPSYLLLRPHAVHVDVQAAKDDNQLEGGVTSVRFFGDRIRLEIELAPSVSVVAELSPQVDQRIYEVGDRVTVSLHPSDCILVS